MDLDAAGEWLADHVNLEAILANKGHVPSLERMRQLMGLLGDPQRSAPVIHITGTNGKGSTARMISSLLASRGLAVGTLTSPNLERLNERIARNGEPVSDHDLASALSAVAAVESLMDDRPNWFEIVTAAGFWWFADVAVDAMVIEVGLGGRWDATNVADGTVAVVTNVSLDHAEIIGPTLADIATEKAGIVKPGATLVLGERDEALEAIFTRTPAGQIWRRDDDFEVLDSRVAHGGRLLQVRTPGATYEDLFLALHGRYQGENAAIALAAAEAFFGQPLSDEVVAEAFATVQSPGRMEVMGRRPLTIIDGAHNPAGVAALAEALDEEFGAVGGRVVLVGLLRGREPDEMLEPLLARGDTRLVVACAPPSPRSMAPLEIVGAATRLGVPAVAARQPADALRAAREAATPDDLLLITGSLYLVGAIRPLVRQGA